MSQMCPLTRASALERDQRCHFVQAHAKHLCDFFSDKSESKTKKRKVSDSTTNSETSIDPPLPNEAGDDDDPSKEDDVNPLDEGWEASSILGATDVEGQVHFLIQW